MGYGLEITGENDGFIFDSGISGARYMPVVKVNGTASVDGTYTDYALGDLIFAKPSAGTGKIFTDFRDPSSPKVGDANGQGVAQTYILARPSAGGGTQVTNANGSTYGLQILDTDGSTVMFDSRQTSNGFDIKATKGYGSCAGGYNVDAVHSSYPSSEQIYTSYSSSTYILMNNSYSHDFGMFESHIGYDFKSGGTIIYFIGWWFLNAGGGATQYGALSNSSEIVVGDLI